MGQAGRAPLEDSPGAQDTEEALAGKQKGEGAKGELFGRPGAHTCRSRRTWSGGEGHGRERGTAHPHPPQPVGQEAAVFFTHPKADVVEAGHC